MTGAERARSFIAVRDGGRGLDALAGGVFAIGNFDGVHRGHRAVIATAQTRAAALAAPAAALTFEPHPRAFFQPETPLFRLTDERNKLRLFAAAGLDGAVVLTFDAALASLTAEDFVRRILVERLGAAGVVVGSDFHFGKNRQGSPDFLLAQGRAHAFDVDIVPPFEHWDMRVSSGPIRDALAAGDIALANDLLGYPWFVTATVIHGDERGRALGFPTANLRLDPACRLKHGIYAVRVGLGGARHDGVASFGRRPTFDNGAPLLEVFLFDFDRDIYGGEMDVAFIGWIRDENRFGSIEELVRAMAEDSRRAKVLLARAKDAFPPIA
jgi:riboflavin kinase / FMN adenylyltransferase